MIHPPFTESAVWVDIESLFWRRSFSKSVGDIGTIYQKVFSGRYSVEESGACLVNTVGIRFIQNFGLTRPRRSIACPASLLSCI